MRSALATFVVASLPFLAASLALRPPPATTADDAEKAPPRPGYGRPAKVRPAPGLSAALFAKEPLVQDPVAFCIDEHGRFFVAESERQERGIEDNRSSSWWLLDDIQSKTTDDRLRMYEKWASKREGGMDYYRRYADRVTRIEDSDGDDRADRQTIFAGPFNEPLDGTGAGLVARDGDVWYTNIPNLWRLRDSNNDGVADAREKIWSGFGVRTALRGHDMHGLTWGPDGKLYWSIGDRGYHVTLPDGSVLADPRSGAVFRCYPDGSGIELFCTGLRNPQELAFDDFGNLFTGDNNSDAGDKARIVYCVEGGQTGWSMDYQSLEGSNVRGPWNQEEIWALRADLAPDKVTTNSRVQPAWTLPPLAHVGSGPAGLAFYPGLGLPDRYAGHFFLCDFLGGDAYSRVLSFALEPVGAGFKVVDVHPFIENVLPTDIDFGYDGKIYVSDWAGGWYSKSAGEIYSIWDAERIKDPRIAEVTALFREGFSQRSTEALGQLLHHADRRVRQRAQWAIAERGPTMVPFLSTIAASSVQRLARIHAIWALGMIAMDGAWPNAVASLHSRLDDPDDEIRAQCAKVIGDARYAAAQPELVRGLSDSSLRVRFFCAIALGKLGAKDSHAPIVAMLAENDGNDVFVRHAGVWALTQLGDRATTSMMAVEPQTELRLCAALVLRRWKDPSIARLLQDNDDRVVAEAARAINDLGIDEATPQLVALSRRYVEAESVRAVPTTEFTRDVWRNVQNGGELDLDKAAQFSLPPTDSDVAPVFEGRAKLGDHYLQRVHGVLQPLESGPYIFYIASDDQSVLYLSSDDSVANKTRIAWVDGYSARGDWSGQPNQVSQPVMLETGKRYYIEARQGEGGGDDFVAVGWQKPDGTLERPIGGGAGKPHDAAILRRIINACVRTDDVAAASALGDLARSAAVPEAMRIEALAALGEWMKPGPRDRVNGNWRPVDGAASRNVEAYQTVLKQKLPGIATNGTPALRAAARELATTARVTLDGTANLDVVLDAKQPDAERVACLRQLCVDRDARTERALEAAIHSDAPLLRAEARRQIAKRDAQKGVPLLKEALGALDLGERQSAIIALGETGGSESESLIGEVLSRLEQGQLEPALRVDLLKAAAAHEQSTLATRAAAWLAAQDGVSRFKRFDVAIEGGDARRGYDVVHFHTSATCLKCHTVAGTGGDAAPKLDGVATRLERAKLLESLIQPGAVVAAGFGQTSAMPSMSDILTLEELRDVVEYLSTLK
ncbi:MAG: PVC-type heme-binding CxxCH protein [Phycisphaerae bacterium]|nr:PVC-type heme-binding CxxCH protein [Phycisphaerae bacterium]